MTVLILLQEVSDDHYLPFKSEQTGCIHLTSAVLVSGRLPLLTKVLRCWHRHTLSICDRNIA